MQRVTLVLFLSALAWSEKTSKQLFYTPVNTGSLQHGLSQLGHSQSVPHGQSPLYSFWSNLHAGNSQLSPSSHVQYVPFNSHFSQGQSLHAQHHGQQYFVLSPAAPIQQHHHQSQPVQSDDVNHEDDTVVIAAPESSLRSDEDTKVIQADQPASHTHLDKTKYHITAPVSDLWSFNHESVPALHTPSGFQRGHIESRPSNLGFSYQAEHSNNENSQLNWGGFHRGHVEHRPQNNKPALRVNNNVNSQSHKSTYYRGFDRGAVESQPPHQPITLKRSANPKVICYFANWSWYRKGAAKYLPENVHPEVCTHIIYAFATYDKYSMSIKESDSSSHDENRKLLVI